MASYIGELISLAVACSWTAAALMSEMGTRRVGVMTFNVWRLGTALLFSLILVYALTGSFGPVYAGGETWLWMGLSGFVGFFFGDYCLFKSYLYISSRYTQLFMTLSPAAAAAAAWVALGERLTWGNILAMMVTLGGIAIAVLGRSEKSGGVGIGLPWKGILLAIGAALGQGLGLVLSKIGMGYYEQDIPEAMAEEMQTVIPFSANLIRCVAGVACFLLVVLLGKGGSQLAAVAKDRQTLLLTLFVVLTGPFLGVGFSLMAVQYTHVGIAQTLMALTPILIIFPSYWLFRQPITLRGVVGAVVSVVGASLFFLLD